MENKVPVTEKEISVQNEKKGTAGKIIRWVVLGIVVLLAAAAVSASVQYARYVTTTEKGTVVDLTGVEEISESKMDLVRKLFPDALILYNVDLGGLSIPCNQTDLTITDAQGVSAQRLIEAASELPWVSSLNLTGLSVSCEEYEQLRQAYPYAKIQWTVPVLGGLSPDVTVLSANDMASVRELAAAKKWLPALTRVDLTGAVLTDDELRELSVDAPFYGFDVDWSITIYGQQFDYDTTSVRLSGAHITDLSQLSRLPALSELTLDGVSVTDLSPLTSFTMLESITLKNMEVDGIGVLGNMYWLGSFFVDNTNVSRGELNELQRSLPECIIMEL
ncbi:MAG: hypothetical protein E7554_02430 [Ruminococcaceae bacterium]|nr:hypothetical protein [Oscillospiraceae bacterium]